MPRLTFAKPDSFFIAILVSLTLAGFFIFISASLGLLARGGAPFGAAIVKQLLLGIVVGGGCSLAATYTPYERWRRYSPWLFLAALIITALVFVPGVGFEHGGARRWIAVGPLSFQPAEFLKFAFVLYAAAWLAALDERGRKTAFAMLPVFLMLAAVGTLLIAQPNTSTLVVIIVAVAGMCIVAGVRARDLAALAGVAAVGIIALIMLRPYLYERIQTFLDPSRDALGASYQIQQSLIAVGSGGVFGRGFGQSVQKFEYLPEPIGDSIFAVAAEEFGFIGALILILLFLALALRGFRIAAHAPDNFGSLVVTGFIILIVSQSFMNIGAMLAVLPLTGTPLIFVSKGGTALLFALAEAGIIVNVSRRARG
ncbi:MAG: FtsW/RodA/SpoVE family cell cycle protein [bacterium]|nr:FtsW/RodA/SpoVE family cell cycle protein [bacterium]MDZ4284516.1 FtsW/RodA/SpoVE family cell cycle protein [Patescibacteria group bacterium]